MDYRRQKHLRQPKQAARVVCVPSASYIFMTVESGSFSKYGADEVDLIHSFYVAGVAGEIGAVQLLGSDHWVIKIRIRSFVPTRYYYIISIKEESVGYLRKEEVAIKFIGIF